MFRLRSPDRYRLLVWIAGLLSCGSAAFAETVTFHLSTGDRVSGEVLWQNTNSVVISNRWAGQLTLPLDQIVRRTNASDSTNVVTQAKPEPPLTPSIPRKEPSVAQAPSSRWNGEAQVGVDLLYGEKERNIVFARFKLAYTKPYESDPKQYFRNSFDVSAEYGKTDGEKSSERFYASDKMSFDLEKRWYVYNLIGGGHDYRLRIDWQYEAGPGLGYHLIATTNFTLNLEGGVNYQAQFRRDKQVMADGSERLVDSEIQDVYYRLAEEFAWKFGRFSMVEKFEVFPRVNLTGLRARLDLTLSYELWKNLAMNLTVLDLYDSQPAENVSKNELQIRSSLGLKF